MNVDQVNDLLELISISYKTEIPTSMLYSWLDVLQEYDCEEVKASLDEAMGEDRFQTRPPQAQYIVRNLVKKYDKVNYKEQVIYCPICSRPLNQPQYNVHFDRCSSVEYILRQYKRFNLEKKTTKKEWYEMPEEEFREKYNLILEYVKNHTNDNEEKLRIDCIFNPPCSENARKFLNKGR